MLPLTEITGADAQYVVGLAVETTLLVTGAYMGVAALVDVAQMLVDTFLRYQVVTGNRLRVSV